ncbi:hypothetical protein JMUB6875_48900 [Nocardia sp. JMUB6875]|uniref:hypothetical protein n=1 Tax=Nocardia sp. JMUB6875 TaxID=3158170 RepID=UPI0032E7079B
MSNESAGNMELSTITDDQAALLSAVLRYWDNEYSSLGQDFPWFAPIQRPDGTLIFGIYNQVGYTVRALPDGYELIESIPREGDQPSLFYSRYEDIAKAAAFIVGNMFRRTSGLAPLDNWRDSVADGVQRTPINGDWDRYVLARDPGACYVGGHVSGVPFSRALTMTIDEFNEALRSDPGRRTQRSPQGAN